MIGRVLTFVYFGFFVFLWVYTFFGFEDQAGSDRVTTA